MQFNGSITKVQIESPTLCGTMSSPFPFFCTFQKMRDERFKSREDV